MLIVYASTPEEFRKELLRSYEWRLGNEERSHRQQTTKRDAQAALARVRLMESLIAELLVITIAPAAEDKA